MPSDHDGHTGKTAPPQPEQAHEAPTLSSVELDDVLRRRHSRRQRALRLGSLAAVALLATTVVIHAAGVRISRPQTPRAQRPVGVALLSNISFGTLSLNGRPLSGPPPQAVILRDGANDISLTAPPFRSRECRVSWPDLVVLGGQCRVSVGFAPALNPSIEIDYQIALDFDSRDLPPGAVSAALATADVAIRAAHYQTAVPAGQLIATDWTPRSGTIASVAAPPLTQAQLSFAPASTPACPTGLCAGSEFIPDFPGSEPPGVPAWMLNVGVTYTWRFVTPDGRSLGSVTYPTDAQASFAIAPDANGNGGWHIWQPPPRSANDVMRDALNLSVCDWASVFRVAMPGVPSPANVGTNIGAGIEGCAFDLQGPGGALAGTLVWRFGVLLAADDPAHAHYPKLPVAPASELQAVGGG